MNLVTRPGILASFFTAALALCLGPAIALAQPGTAVSPEENNPAAARNVILFIGDGMGLATVQAAAYTSTTIELDAQGNPPALGFEKFPVFGYLSTWSANSFITDSAAGATVYSCGQKTTNGSLCILPDGTPMTIITEAARKQGRKVGVVSSVGVNHATPAAFYAKAASRGSYDDIMMEYFSRRIPDVLLGGGYFGEKWPMEEIQGYAHKIGTMVITTDTLAELNPVSVNGRRVLGLFDTNGNHQLDPMITRPEGFPEPRLRDLALGAVDILSNSPKGFFLMVEGGAIDWAAHGNDAPAMVSETREFAEAISAVMERLQSVGQLDSTLVIVTADHETGGVTLTGPNGDFPSNDRGPEITFASKGHTAIPVPLYATGPGSRLLAGKHDNTLVYQVMLAAIETTGTTTAGIE